MYFYALIHKDHGSAYGASFPDVPGCFSAADDLADLEANAIEALGLWFEDQPLGEPRDIEALRNDPAVATELAQGAFLLAIPYIPDDTVIERLNITMPRGLRAALDAAARRRKVTRSGFIAEAVRSAIPEADVR